MVIVAGEAYPTVPGIFSSPLMMAVMVRGYKQYNGDFFQILSCHIKDMSHWTVQ